MTKDKELADLFLAAKPSFDDRDQFLASLNKRLDAVEFLKQHEEACIRRYKYCMVVAFVLGILCGGGLLAFILSIPDDVPLFSFNVQSGILLFLQQNSRLITTTLLSCLICFGIVSIVNIMQDIINLKEMNGKSYPIL